MKKILLNLIMIVLLLSVILVAYAATAASVPEAQKYGGVLKRVLTVGPATPIGYPAEAAPDAYWAAKPALETLIRVKRGGVIEPVLATNLKVAPDRNSIIVTLRKGVKFHDGSDFNAQVAKWNMDKIIEAKKTRDWTSVDVIDDYTIRINIKVFKNTVLTNLGQSYTEMISPTAVEKNGLDWARWHPVGTGPFVFVEYQRDAKLVFKKNKNYWNKGKPYLDGLEFVVIADETVRKMAFQRGDIHQLAAEGLLAQELKNGGYPYDSEPGGTYVLIPDSKNADSPFADKRVRLAVSHAIDREGLAQALGYGFSNPAYQLFPSYKETALPNLDIHEFNPEKARKLLAEAGYPNGFKTTIHTFLRLVKREWILAIVNMLEQVGISAEGDFPEAGKYTEYRMKGWKNGLMAHGLYGFDNLNSSFSFYFGGIQFPSLKKPEGWDATFDAALNSENVEPAKTQALVKLIHDDVMVIPYFEQTMIEFYQKGVHLPDFNVYRAMTFVCEDVWLEPNLR
jgi:peptide/nickel transport system substrate-binding protein